MLQADSITTNYKKLHLFTIPSEFRHLGPQVEQLTVFHANGKTQIEGSNEKVSTILTNDSET